MERDICKIQEFSPRDYPNPKESLRYIIQDYLDEGWDLKASVSDTFHEDSLLIFVRKEKQ